MQKPQAVLFDIDETLVSTGGAGAESWRWAFDELYGVPADIGAHTSAGMTDPEVCRLTFREVVGREPGGEELVTVLAHYLLRLPVELAESTAYRVLPGVSDLLLRLGVDGVLLGLTSGALEASAHMKLAHGGLSRHFLFGGYGSDSQDRAELTRLAIAKGGRLLGAPLDLARVLVVGDTPHDIDAGNAAGAVSVGVATGHFTRRQLLDAGAAYALETLAEPLPGTAPVESGAGSTS